jgi:hypothetical protein
MKLRTLALFSAMTLFAALGLTIQTFVQKTEAQIIIFDAPGAGTGSGQGTTPTSINAAGTITGYYYDVGGAAHGFLIIARGRQRTG